MDDMDIEEDCPLCCDPYNTTQYERSRVICSAESGCGTFSICRLCVFRQDMHLREKPFVVDEDTGDFVHLDPTVCPQCKRPGAFREDQLPPLSEDVRRSAEDEARRRREEETRRQREQALRCLEGAPRAALEIRNETGGFEVVDQTQHKRIQIISGDCHRDQFRVDRYGNREIFMFEGSTTVGVPDLLSCSGVIYYEIEMKGSPLMFFLPRIQFGFSLANGMEVTDGQSEKSVGDNARSWGFDGFSGYKIHIEPFGDERLKSKWGPEKVIGIAANIGKGMIAVSVDGDWGLVNGNGVKFEEESIKNGMYPCISGNRCGLEIRFGPDFKHAPPPESLWDIWPKFEDKNWLGITAEARAAAMTLGYTQQSWMGEGNPIDRKSWSELSNEERAAANTLGYNVDIWAQLMTLRANADDSDDSDSSDEDSDATSRSPFTVMLWNNLPGDVRRAAETLGYTPSIWNNNDARGPMNEKNWDELTPEQQRAVIILGLDEESWNEDSESDSSDSDSMGMDSDSSDSDSSDNGGLFDNMSWSELPGYAREAAQKLRHTAESWDQDIKGPWDDKRWEELPLEQEFAAAVLGYDESKWNNAIDLAHDLAAIIFLGRPRQR